MNNTREIIRQVSETKDVGVPQQLVFQQVRLTSMSAIKKAKDLLEDRLAAG